MAAKPKSTGKSRVARVPVKAKLKTDPGPVTSKADLRENTAPARGAGPTKVGSNTPAPSRGRSSSTVKDASPRTRDLSQATSGQSIVSRVNAVTARRGAAKKRAR
jgi:hypothetical protein